MRHATLLVVPFALLACSPDAPAFAEPEAPRFVHEVYEQQSAEKVFLATLSGANEVGANGATGVGDPDGSGGARIVINVGKGTLCSYIAVNNIMRPATGAHVHEGEAGTNGPVVVGLTAPGTSGPAEGCTTVERRILAGIISKPAEYYVNVHNTEYPGGAVRGQLMPRE